MVVYIRRNSCAHNPSVHFQEALAYVYPPFWPGVLQVDKSFISAKRLLGHTVSNAEARVTKITIDHDFGARASIE